MGGLPRWALVGLGCPDGTGADEVEAFYEGAVAVADEHGVAVVGGDTSVSPSGGLVSVTLLGEAARPVLRSTARPGDVVAVTDTLGRAAAGLAVLERETAPRGVDSALLDDVTGAHLRPRARVGEGRWLADAGGVTAMMDLSDGLATDLGRLVAESSVGAHVDVERLPIAAATRAVADALDVDPVDWATGGGEDYELLVVCDPVLFARLRDGLADATGTALTAVGEIMAGSGTRWLDGRGRAVAVAPGFEHFRAVVERPVRWLEWLLAPIRGVLAGLTTLTVRLLGRGAETQAALSEEELRTLVDVGASEGVVEREEREMIHKVFELEDTLVRSVMVPRTDMFCLDVETPVAEILPALREQLHSRVPVFEGSIDVIVGVLYTKDLLPFVRGLPPDFDLRSKLHPPYFVPESKRADALLQEFQAKKLHIAVVVDEYGGTAGLVALEDLLEELVGEIADEYDEPERLIQQIDPTTFLVAGKLGIDELNAATGLAVPKQSYDTVGAWVLDLFGRVPRQAE